MSKLKKVPFMVFKGEMTLWSGLNQ